jgi:hypothetical protein
MVNGAAMVQLDDGTMNSDFFVWKAEYKASFAPRIPVTSKTSLSKTNSMRGLCLILGLSLDAQFRGTIAHPNSNPNTPWSAVG